MAQRWAKEVRVVATVGRKAKQARWAKSRRSESLYNSRLRAVAPALNCYVAFKVRGEWYIAESLEQHEKDHRDRLDENRAN